MEKLIKQLNSPNGVLSYLVFVRDLYEVKLSLDDHFIMTSLGYHAKTAIKVHIDVNLFELGIRGPHVRIFKLKVCYYS